MFRDNSLIPAEAIRLAALGFLAEEPRRYGDLALAIRHFTSHIVGPSLDLMGTSVELLRYEGLVEAVEGEATPSNALLRLTERGATTLRELLQARLRTPASDLNRLTLLVKLRFLKHLPAAEQQAQLTLMAEALANERARLGELRRQQTAPDLFADWLDHDIAMIGERITWLQRHGAAVPAA